MPLTKGNNKMRNLLLILLCLPMIGFGQVTMIPDPNFEQLLIDLGYDNVLDGSVNTSSIDTITYLNVSMDSISNLDGIEDFTSLTELRCDDNLITSLDLSSNYNLITLDCSFNYQLSNLNISGAINLKNLSFGETGMS